MKVFCGVGDHIKVSLSVSTAPPVEGLGEWVTGSECRNSSAFELISMGATI